MLSNREYASLYLDKAKWAAKYGILKVPKFLADWEDTSESKKRRLLLAPVGHGKSWLAAKVEALHRICFNQNVRILIVSKSREQAINDARMVRREIETNEWLQGDFGIEPTEHWSDASFTIERTANLKEPTVTAAGLYGQVEGLRLDFILGDDLIDWEVTFSEAEREKTKDWFDNTLQARLEPKGSILCIGTRWHPQDLYAHIMEKPGWDVRTYSAYLPDGSVLWEERWPKERLEAQRADMGETQFQFKFMNNAVALEGTAFKWDWVTDNIVERAPEGLRMLSGVDPATTKRELAKRDPDSTAIVTGGIKDGHVYVLDVELAQIDTGQADLIAHTAMRWGVVEAAVEANAFQKLIIRDLQQRYPSLNVWAEEHYTTDKVQRILDLQPRFQSGVIHFVRGCRNFDRFEHEYKAFPLGTHDDILDALEMMVKRGIQRGGFVNPNWGKMERAYQMGPGAR